MVRRWSWLLLSTCVVAGGIVIMAVSGSAASPCDGLQSTPFFTHYYGRVTLGSIPAPEGTIVEARSPRGDLVGCFVVHTAGNYGLMRVYGEDASGGIPGMREGEPVVFYASGEAATSDPPVINWHNDRSYREVHLALPVPAAPTETPTQEQSPSSTPTPTPTSVHPPQPIATATPSRTPTIPTQRTPTPSPAPSFTPTRTPSPSHTPSPSLTATPPSGGRYPGVYMAYDYTGHDPEEMGTVGSLAAFHWAQVEVAEGQYTWGVIDHWLEMLDRCGLKGAFFITPFEGGCNGARALPPYLRQDSAATWRRPLPTRCRDSGENVKILLRYTSARYEERYAALIQRLGQRYAGDPRVAFIAIGVGLYGETWPAQDKEDLVWYREHGLDSASWVAFVNQVTDWYARAFQASGGSLRKPLLLQAGAVAFAGWERPQMSQHALRQGIGVSVNAMHPDGERVLFGEDPSCALCGWYDFPLRHWREVPTAWEGYYFMTCRPETLWWAITNALSKHPTYLRLARDLFFDTEGRQRQDFVDIIRWGAQYLGVDEGTAPSAWVAMREHRDPWYPYDGCIESLGPTHGHPQWGNYSLFLYQRDELPGGRTVPETNDARVQRLGQNARPYNPDLPPGTEGWVTRRTDYRTGNRYIFLDVDDGFAYGEVTSLQVQVTYWDRGRDAWRLVYRDASGQERSAATASGETVVHKTDTRQWRTVTFSLLDASLRNGLPDGPGGADFALDSLDDGDEWVHFVEVERTDGVSGQEPMRTPTSTPTQASTPEVDPVPNPTATPSSPGGQPAQTDVVVPYRESDISIDGDLGEWGVPLAQLDALSAAQVHGDPSAADAVVQFWGAWDNEGLVLAFRVQDDVLVADSDDIWRDDSIEIGLDADHDHHFTWNGPDFQFTVAVDGRWARLGRDTPDPLIERATQQDGTGWVVEIRIPWSVLTIPPGTPGRVLGFTFAYHDDDTGGNWDTYLIWAGGRTNTSDADYGHLILSLGESVTPAPTPAPTVSGGTPPACFREIRGRVFWDTNRDGVRQAGEPGIGGNYVVLQGPVSSATNTAPSGAYAFVGLYPGTYRIATTLPEGAVATSANPVSAEVPEAACAVVQDVSIGVAR